MHVFSNASAFVDPAGAALRSVPAPFPSRSSVNPIRGNAKTAHALSGTMNPEPSLLHPSCGFGQTEEHGVLPFSSTGWNCRSFNCSSKPYSQTSIRFWSQALPIPRAGSMQYKGFATESWSQCRPCIDLAAIAQRSDTCVATVSGPSVCLLDCLDHATTRLEQASLGLDLWLEPSRALFLFLQGLSSLVPLDHV